jgi:hypothetical protein
MAIWDILWSFWVFPVLVSCTKKNLATPKKYFVTLFTALELDSLEYYKRNFLDGVLPLNLFQVRGTTFKLTTNGTVPQTEKVMLRHVSIV